MTLLAIPQSPLIIARAGTPFVNISLMFTDTTGLGFALPLNPTVAIYRVDPTTGSLALDVTLGTSGILTLVPEPSTPITGLYGAGLNVAGALFENYVLIVSYYAGLPAITPLQTLLRMFLSTDLQSINANSITQLASRATHVAS